MPERSSRCHRNPEFNSYRQQFIKVFGRPIETYDAIKRATETVGEVSKNNYYRNLPSYFMFLNEDPDTVIKNRRKHLAEDNPEMEEYYERKTKAYINLLKEKGFAGRGINGIYGRIQGFYTNNSRRYSLNLKRLQIPKARKNPTFSPDNSQIRELLNYADQRGRLIIAVFAHTGAAPVDVSELQRKDIPLEPWVYCEKSRSKTGEVWRFVTTPDVVAELKVYLKQIGEGSPDDLLFRSREGFLDKDGVSRVVSTIIERAGYGAIKGFTATAFRDAFEDALTDANINFKVKETLMAHTTNLNISAEYGSEAKMQKRLIEAMQKVYPLISLSNNLVNPAELAGFSSEDVAEIKELLGHKTEIKRLLNLAGRGELVHINDPELPKRLRDKGVIN